MRWLVQRSEKSAEINWLHVKTALAQNMIQWHCCLTYCWNKCTSVNTWQRRGADRLSIVSTISDSKHHMVMSCRHHMVMLTPSRHHMFMLTPSRCHMVMLTPSRHHMFMLTPSRRHMVMLTPSRHHMFMLTPSRHHMFMLTPSRHHMFMLTPSRHHMFMLTPSRRHMVMLTHVSHGHVCFFVKSIVVYSTESSAWWTTIGWLLRGEPNARSA